MAPRFSVEQQTPNHLKYSLAMHILNDIAPRIMSINNPLSARVATAYTWFLFLKQNSPPICEELCGSVKSDPREWGEAELSVVAEALTRYASRMVDEALNVSDRVRERRVPRSPRPPVV